MKHNEIIGKHTTIKGTTITGDIINETQHTITIKTAQGERRVQKRNHIFIIEDVCVNGSDLAYKPHERIKLKAH